MMCWWARLAASCRDSTSRYRGQRGLQLSPRVSDHGDQQPQPYASDQHAQATVPTINRYSGTQVPIKKYYY